MSPLEMDPPRRSGRTVLQGGRAKAYRPLPVDDRRTALHAGLEAYDRGDWFLAHELLEPAWMGTSDLAERELLQGVIKLAAAFVHDARSNPAGIEKNLRGARERLAAGVEAGRRVGIDAEELVRRVDAWLVTPGGPPILIPRGDAPSRVGPIQDSG
jgi:hypothetical protein